MTDDAAFFAFWQAWAALLERALNFARRADRAGTLADSSEKKSEAAPTTQDVRQGVARRKSSSGGNGCTTRSSSGIGSAAIASGCPARTSSSVGSGRM